jgi:hypothetical protein
VSRRTAAALGAVLLAAGLTVPAAAAKPPCRLIPDDAGDASWGDDAPGGGIPGSAADDVLSADLASDGRTLTAVLRLAALPPQDPEAPLGRRYLVHMAPAGAKSLIYLGATRGPLGTTFDYGYLTVDAGGTSTMPLGRGTGRFDDARREVHVSAPTSGFRSRGTIRRGTHLVSPTAVVQRQLVTGALPNVPLAGATVPLGTLGLVFDRAQGRTYVVGTPTCVRVGG